MCVGSRTRAGGLRAVLFATVATALMSLPAHGALLGRDINGNPTATNTDPAAVFEYDTDLDLTWLREWNYAQASNCSNSFDPGGGFPLQYYGFDCTGSEMGHMGYTELGKIAGSSTNTDPFQNLQFFLYWSGTEYASNTAWDFNTIAGSQVNPGKFNPFYAVAVAPDDVAAWLPDPGSLVILTAGLWALAAAVRRRLRRVSLAPT
jgi:hypothetical protein